MTNAVLQKNEEVLRNLLATLLEMDEADIVDCHLENPIELGKEIEGKECILDVKLTLNNAKIINIELQVYKQTYWVERSLLYWARAFDSLKSGQDYSMLLPTYHIGILDFTLFEDHPKFMAQYLIMDAEDKFQYSDKLCIKVLDLTQLDAARKQKNVNKKLLKIDLTIYGVNSNSMAWLSMNLLVWINIYLIYYNMMNAIFGRVILEIISLWFYKFKIFTIIL